MVELCMGFRKLFFLFLLFFFKSQTTSFIAKTEGNSCHSEKGEEKDSTVLKLGHELT